MMLSYQRAAFDKAHRLLVQLKTEPHNTDILFDLQVHLIGEVRKTEAKIREYKNKLRDAEGTRDSLVKLWTRKVETYQYTKYIWNCFGDGIAFIYYDRFTLKHTYYDVDTINVKQDSGFISDKVGFYHEFALLRKATALRIPCILCDLTNVIRFGDVCFAIDADPTIVEVKQTKRKLDRRGKRQKRKNAKLKQFYDEDESDDFRGGNTVYRTEFSSELEDSLASFDLCITMALEHESAVCAEHDGVAMIGLTKPDNDVFELFSGERYFVSYLNGLKSSMNWQPFYPFTLSITSTQSLWEFVCGRVSVLCALSRTLIEELANAKGLEVTIVENEEPRVRFTFDVGEEAYVELAHIFHRAVVEGISPRWLVDSATDSIELMKERAKQATHPFLRQQ